MAHVLPLAAGLILSALVAGAQHPLVGVFMEFDSSPGAAAVAVMEKEVNALLKPSGVALDWRLTADNHGDQAFSKLVVLKFKGTCNAKAAGDETPGGDVALGETQVSDGHVLPFTEVQCDQIRQALAYLRPGALPSERQSAMGVALGRVVAHELYHILAKTTSHAAAGLAKATQSLEELVSRDTLSFRDRDSEAIRRGANQ